MPRSSLSRMLRSALPATFLSVTLLAAACASDSDSTSTGTNGSTTPTEQVANSDPTEESDIVESDETPTQEPTSTEAEVVEETEPTATPAPTAQNEEPDDEPEQTVTPAVEIPSTVQLRPMTHAYQTLNNCAAVSVSMALSYFDIHYTQEELGPVFRPNPGDKHVEPDQLVSFFPEHNLNAPVIHGGSVERIKELVALEIPVIVAQWLDFDEDKIGHYRIVRGYDDERGGFLVNDSMTGENVLYPYDEFEDLWRAFNYRYMPVYGESSKAEVEALIGENMDTETSVNNALSLFQEMAEQNPNDPEIWFSIGSSYYELGQYEDAVDAYERAASIGLPSKMLWYQFYPVEAYNEIGKHQAAIDLATEQIDSAGTFGEMRYERGRAHEALGNIDLAIADYQQALVDDEELKAPKEALDRLDS